MWWEDEKVVEWNKGSVMLWWAEGKGWMAIRTTITCRKGCKWDSRNE